MDFDSTKISYERLLDAFWNGHDPTIPSYSLQYRSAIFYADEEQHRIALASKLKEESRLGKPVATVIIPLGTFYLAEEYHQKYYLRETPELMAEISDIYPDFKGFLNSTAVARINGYLGGYGDQEALKTQVTRLGLSVEGQQTLIQITATGLRPACPIP
jgi:peptide-methionine (S)-S-oxide reductase